MKKAEINKQGVFQGTMVEEGGNVRILGEDLTIGANLWDASKYPAGSLDDGSVVTNDPNNYSYTIYNDGRRAGARIQSLGFNGGTGPYTASMTLSCSHNLNVKVDICDESCSTAPFGFAVTQTPKFYSFTFNTVTNYNTANNYNGFLDIVISAPAGGATLYVDHVKVESGTVATPWIPNSADAAYSKLGFASANPNIHDPIKAEDFYEF